jgi:hypothetical protein
VTDQLWFQWGYLPGALVRTSLVYDVGDVVRWRVCADGVILPWAWFGPTDSNAGDPAILDLIVLEANGWLENYLHACGIVVGGAAIEIRGRVLQRAWLYRPGEFDRASDLYSAGTDHFQVGPDGEVIPRPDWTHHSITQVDLKGCGEVIRLVEAEAGEPRRG